MEHIVYHDLFEDEVSAIIRGLDMDYIKHDGVMYSVPGLIVEDGYATKNRPVYPYTIKGLYMRFYDSIGNNGYIAAESLVSKLAHDTFMVIKA